MLPLLLLILLIFPKNPVFAAGEFTVSQNIRYDIDQSGSAKVEHEIILTNNISQIYAKEYQINIAKSQINNLTADNSAGTIPVTVSVSGAVTGILLKFSDPVIGKDRVNKFNLHYTIPGFAQNKGKTWELQFPVYDDQDQSQQTNIVLNVPESFGDLSFSSIPITSSHLVSNTSQIKFSQSSITNKILLVFGNHQLFDFRLLYDLKNDDPDRIFTEIPIPPDTNTQTITFDKIDPKPSEIRTDDDGNWLARYDLDPGQYINVTVTGQANIHPDTDIESGDSGKLTSSQKYWETDNPDLIAVASPLATIKDIYRFVVNHLSYNFSQIDSAKRQGAAMALQYPEMSLCTEFTDLFVTLSRIKGIPAREIEGYAYSNNTKIKPLNQNSDVLHAWPEYFDSVKNHWYQIDPTWEKTTNGIDYFSDLDLNHLAFVIHGQNSSDPAPPGSYKLDKSTKTVFVDFAKSEIGRNFLAPVITINQRQLTVKNPNLFRLQPAKLKLDRYNLDFNIPPLPPLGTYQLTLPRLPFFQIIAPAGDRFHFSLTTPDAAAPVNTSAVNPLHFLYISYISGAAILILCIGGIILTASTKSHAKNS